jgi:2,4-dienoyl-CoA reductase-like NADH-dependent reductase (Old Yellow Enzyme family)
MLWRGPGHIILAMPTLFDPLRLRGVALRSRIGMSPMCMYSAVEGIPQTWHITHLGARAIGGAALVMAEATAVEARGRISLGDTGLWNDAQRETWRPIAEFIAAQGAVPGIQLAHAGRKAGTARPWEGGKPLALKRDEPDGWRDEIIAPSALPFAEGYRTPREMTRAEMDEVLEAFVAATRRAYAAGFKLIELHFAHGYLMHSFLSPLTNARGDAYGGELPGRVRFPLEVVEAVRAAWPGELPLLVRLSCSDWLDGGWDIAQSVSLARLLKKLGVDMIDCSSGGTTPESRPPVPPHVNRAATTGHGGTGRSGAGLPALRPDAPRDGRATELEATEPPMPLPDILAPLYQLPFAEAIRREAAIPTAAVGLITTGEQARRIIAEERADMVMIGRAMLRDPHWALNAARELDADAPWPKQYARAR